MKLKLLFATALLVAASSVSTVHADQSTTPDLLATLSAESVSALSFDESANTRGEKVTKKLGGFEVCKWGRCISVGAKFVSYWVPYRIDGKFIYFVDY